MIAWISTICGMLGAILCASGMQASGYPIFMVGSLAGIWTMRNGNVALLVQFAFFAICNMIGIINYTFGV